MEEEKELLRIIRSYLNNEDYDFSKTIDEKKLYEIAFKNKMTLFLEKWANTVCKSQEIKKKIYDEFNYQILKDTNENIELEEALKSFEENNVKTLLVKGIITKEIYPQNYMRQMYDMDLLVDFENFQIASKIMKNLGYEEFYNYEKHLIFSKKPFVVIEMHRKLLLKKDVGYEYFENVWDKANAYKDYKNIYVLNDSDAYIFCILHLMLHFKFTGILIRDILDVYLYNEKFKNNFDKEKQTNIFEQLGVSEFEKKIKKIAYKWFGNEEIKDFSDVEKFIFDGMSMENDVNYSLIENKSKEKYLLKLFFPEFKIMKEKYPILKKIPVLLPFTWMARIFKDIFSKESTISSRFDKIKLIQESSENEIKDKEKIYREIGIIRKD